MPPSIFDYITQEENAFETEEIQVGQNWTWNFRAHVQLIFHLKNGRFFTGNNDWMRAFKNIMEPILNLAYWSEDIEVKDIVFYIENVRGRVLSFLVKKYHDDVYVKKHNIDKMIDDITESDLDFGGVLVQPTYKGCPEVIKLPTVAFCDQSDILGGPIGVKFHFSPSKLRKMKERGWGSEANGANISIDELIMLADNERSPYQDEGAKKNKATGKSIEVYIVRGDLPEAYLLDNDIMEDYYAQLQVVAFYTTKDNQRKGVVLYRKKANDDDLKFFTCKEVPGRALGRGEGEGLLHPQVWTNWLTIHKHNLLEAASKVPLVTDDPAFTNKNEIRDLENLQVATLSDGKTIRKIDTVGVNNIQLFASDINSWYDQAQLTGSAFDPILGKEGASGTTFRGQERTVAQGRGLHDRRRGQRAKFIEEIYRDLIIPDIKKEILRGQKFLATLTGEEVQWVVDRLAENYAHGQIIASWFRLEVPLDKQAYIQDFRDKFLKEGNKVLVDILKDEFEDVEIKMGINVAGKQKDLVGLTDKILSVFQFAFANPQGFQQVLQMPGMGNAFNNILEFSNISPVDFASFSSQAFQSPQPQPQQQQQIEQGGQAEALQQMQQLTGAGTTT
jgi:hypothetical protein